MIRALASLRLRLLGLALLVALPALGFVLYSGFEQRQLAKARSLTEARRLTDLACADIDEAVRDSRTFLQSLAQVPAVRRGEIPATESILRGVLRQKGSPLATGLSLGDNERAPSPGSSPYGNLGFADLQGRVLASGVPLPGPVNVSDRLYFQRALATRDFALGEYQVGRITGRPGLNVGYPVLGLDGSPRGVVFAAIDLGWLSTAPQPEPLPQGAVLLVLDHQGTVLARSPGGGRWVGSVFPDQPLVRTILARREGVVEATGLEGVDRLWTFRPVAGTEKADAFVALGLETSAIFGGADRSLRAAVLALLAGAAVVAFLLSLWARAFILKPVDTMVATTRRLRAGDMAARTGARDSGELGDLGRAFDEMAEDLQAREQQLERAAAALRASNETLQAVLTASPAAIVVLDCERRVRLWTSGAERIFGWRADEMIGQVQPAFIPAEQKKDSLDLAGRALAGERLVDVAVQRVRRDGTTLDLSLSTAPLRGPDGVVSGIVVVYVDVTARHQLERQLYHAQKMEAVGRLAGGVAHDFNNLLTVIQGFSEIVLRRVELDVASRRDLEEVHKAALRASSLTSQLLTFSRRQTTQPRVVDLNAVVADMTKMLQRLIGEDIELETRMGTRLGRVRVDPGQVEQVIANLAVNARDAMPDGGRLVIETTNRRCTAEGHRCKAECGGACVALAVSDTGMGIDAETLPHIFEPFFTTKEHGRGTGLGLAMVYGIVQECGGDVAVTSEPGRGSSFVITFPLAGKPESVAAEPKPSPVAAPRSGTVLLVEDEDAVRALERTTLERRGYSVLEARRGDEALEAAGRHAGPIDLVVTDVVMPGMGGIEAARKLRAARPGIRVLYLSGYAAGADAGGGAGLDGPFLPKPFTLDDFARRVGELVEDSGAAS